MDLTDRIGPGVAGPGRSRWDEELCLETAGSVDDRPHDAEGMSRMARKAQPLHKRLLVRRVEKGTVNGAIILPGAAKGKPREGEVLAVGNGKDADNRTTVALEVKVGDRILFGKYSGIGIKIGVEDLLILREDEFLVVVA